MGPLFTLGTFLFKLSTWFSNMSVCLLCSFITNVFHTFPFCNSAAILFSCAHRCYCYDRFAYFKDNNKSIRLWWRIDAYYVILIVLMPKVFIFSLFYVSFYSPIVLYMAEYYIIWCNLLMSVLIHDSKHFFLPIN